MMKLSDNVKVACSIANSILKVLKSLYIIIFGNVGESRMISRNLKNFEVFNFKEGSEEYNKKFIEIKEKFELSDLIPVCNILDLDLDFSGDKEELAKRVCLYLMKLSSGDVDEDDDDDIENSSDDRCSEISSLSIKTKYRSCKNSDTERESYSRRSKSEFSLTFRDIEDSIIPFTGSDEYPIEKWIRDFEELEDGIDCKNLFLLRKC